MYFSHVTLDTGHRARQPREAVADTVIEMMRPILDSALTGGKPAVPGCEGYHLASSHATRNTMLATLYHDDGTPILTTAVCLKSRDGPKLWRMLHERPLATRPDDPPPAPWIADRLEPGAMAHPDALAWTGDFSRCLAWAWAEYDR
ncbi:hypothetical protein [Consotaella salsifontis]|uniref:Uncharacterized protein n=1 Tax=Consotaella salsifontis TaxID=1365950 RepID=A0A1T4SSJ3_9HYPH|nr:hypothetical protein [Consotaella salsifontis]SKA31126.1 hypothetical protein SAMN05428963_113121 [Consotaella salsifontis]